MINRRAFFSSLTALGVWPFTSGSPDMKSSSVSSQQKANEAVVRRYANAWEKNDVATIVDCYHDEVVFHYFGRSPLAGTHMGKPAALAVLKKIKQLTNRQLIEIVDVLASDKHAMILARERFERGGRTLELKRVLIYHIRDGKLAECWVYDEDQRAVDEYYSG